jgi:acetoin utilization deacetylase AcuC-like enzyme
MGGGYCLFNNVAVAALHALEQHQLERVAIVDFDVHHGNGTQAIFAEDPRVLFISVHQAGNYPLFSGEGQDFNLLGHWQTCHA